MPGLREDARLPAELDLHSGVVDANVHLVAGPRRHAGPGGWMSDWPPGSGLSAEDYRDRMRSGGVEQAVLVTALREDGFDNSSTYEAWRRHPDAFVWVGNVDVTAPFAVTELPRLVTDLHMAGARLVVGDTEDPTAWLEDDRSAAVLAAVQELHVPTSLQKFSMATVHALVAVAGRFPAIPFVLYSMGNPTFAPQRWVEEGEQLAGVARRGNITVVLSPQNVAAIDAIPDEGLRDATRRRVAELFLPDRLAWGSYSLLRGARAGAHLKDLGDLVADVRRLFSFLDPIDLQLILGGVARRLYPGLTT